MYAALCARLWFCSSPGSFLGLRCSVRLTPRNFGSKCTAGLGGTGFVVEVSETQRPGASSRLGDMGSRKVQDKAQANRDKGKHKGKAKVQLYWDKD